LDGLGGQGESLAGISIARVLGRGINPCEFIFGPRGIWNFVEQAAPFGDRFVGAALAFKSSGEIGALSEAVGHDSDDFAKFGQLRFEITLEFVKTCDCGVNFGIIGVESQSLVELLLRSLEFSGFHKVLGDKDVRGGFIGIVREHLSQNCTQEICIVSGRLRGSQIRRILFLGRYLCYGTRAAARNSKDKGAGNNRANPVGSNIATDRNRRQFESAVGQISCFLVARITIYQCLGGYERRPRALRDFFDRGTTFRDCFFKSLSSRIPRPPARSTSETNRELTVKAMP
jgi:hypothetical protein